MLNNHVSQIRSSSAGQNNSTQEREKEDLLLCLRNPSGRKVLCRILSDLGTGLETSSSDPLAMAQSCALKDYAEVLWARIIEVDPAIFAEMQIVIRTERRLPDAY